MVRRWLMRLWPVITHAGPRVVKSWRTRSGRRCRRLRSWGTHEGLSTYGADDVHCSLVGLGLALGSVCALGGVPLPLLLRFGTLQTGVQTRDQSSDTSGESQKAHTLPMVNTMNRVRNTREDVRERKGGKGERLKRRSREVWEDQVSRRSRRGLSKRLGRRTKLCQSESGPAAQGHDREGSTAPARGILSYLTGVASQDWERER